MSSFIDPTAYRAARSSVDGLRASTAESYKQQSAFPFPSFSPSPSSTQQQANPYATKQPAAQNPEPSPTSTNNGRLDSTEKEDDPPPAASNKEVVPTSISKETSKILHFYKWCRPWFLGCIRDWRTLAGLVLYLRACITCMSSDLWSFSWLLRLPLLRHAVKVVRDCLWFMNY